MSQSNPVAEPVTPGCLPLILRLFWLAWGHVALVLIGLSSLSKTGWPGRMNVLFPAVLAGMILARYLDYRVFKGSTSDGRPSNLADVLGYALKLGAFAGAAWFAVRHLAK